MGKLGATTLVLVSGGLLIALALIPSGEYVTGATYKKLWAAGLWTTALGIAADFVPEIVGPFAVLVIIAAIAENRGVLGGFLGTSSKPSSSTAGKAASAVSSASTAAVGAFKL